MIKFKRGVRIRDFTNNYVMLILQVVNDTAPEGYTPTITSANDSKHRKGSGHYDDKAFDIRVRDYPEFDETNMREGQFPIYQWIERMRKWLPEHSYLIVYGVRGHYNHIHIEYIGN